VSAPTPHRLALSPVTIAQCSFLDAIAITAEAGFEGIGLRYDQLARHLREGGTLGGVKRLLAFHRLQVAEAAFLAEWQFHGGVPLVSRRQRTGGPEEAHDRLMGELHTFFRCCEELGCENVTAVPALREVGDLEVAAEEFGSLCDLARPHGLRLCLEFMGSAPQVDTLARAAELVARAGRSNGGILIDTFLFHEGGSDLADLGAVPLDRVFNVQLADAKGMPRERLDMLTDRLFPGEGVAPVEAVVRALAERGYSGWWTVELFNPDYAAGDPRAIAARALASARQVMAQSSADGGRP
jgi:sugar phosphate isomerase/epimerase